MSLDDVKQGFEPVQVSCVVRRRGSHVRLKHPERLNPLTVPLHRELKRGTLAGILKDAGMTPADLSTLL